jgi:hypothetical protein
MNPETITDEEIFEPEVIERTLEPIGPQDWELNDDIEVDEPGVMQPSEWDIEEELQGNEALMEYEKDNDGVY